MAEPSTPTPSRDAANLRVAVPLVAAARARAAAAERSPASTPGETALISSAPETPQDTTVLGKPILSSSGSPPLRISLLAWRPQKHPHFFSCVFLPCGAVAVISRRVPSSASSSIAFAPIARDFDVIRA
jgi:hypothetical protein